MGIAIIAWLSLMLVVPGLVLPGATKAFVDDILVKRFDGWLSPLLVGLAVMFVLQIALSAVQQMALLRLELKLALEKSARFTWHVLRLPVEFFNQRFAGDLANRIDFNDRVARLLARDLRASGGDLLHRVVPRHRHAVLRPDAGGHRRRRRRRSMSGCVR